MELARFSQASINRFAARSTSSSDEYQPTQNRTAPSISSADIPIADKVAEETKPLLWQADPVEAQISGTRFKISCPLTPGKITLRVLGSLAAFNPLIFNPGIPFAK
jgi:hypothetical protein